MRMWLPGHEFGGAFSDALGAFAARVGTVVQEEAEQIQIALAQLPPEEEVAAQPPVEVLDQGAASGVSSIAATTASSTLWNFHASCRFSRPRRSQ